MIKRIFHKKTNSQSSQQQQSTGGVKQSAVDGNDQVQISNQQQNVSVPATLVGQEPQSESLYQVTAGNCEEAKRK